VPPNDLDIDHHAYAIDVPGVDHGTTGGTYDVGADELEFIFADGFESGNTSAWSAAVP